MTNTFNKYILLLTYANIPVLTFVWFYTGFFTINNDKYRLHLPVSKWQNGYLSSTQKNAQTVSYWMQKSAIWKAIKQEKHSTNKVHILFSKKIVDRSANNISRPFIVPHSSTYQYRFFLCLHCGRLKPPGQQQWQHHQSTSSDKKFSYISQSNYR